MTVGSTKGEKSILLIKLKKPGFQFCASLDIYGNPLKANVFIENKVDSSRERNGRNC